MKSLFTTLCAAGMLALWPAAFSANASDAAAVRSLPIVSGFENRLEARSSDARGLSIRNRVGEIDGFSVCHADSLPQEKGQSVPVAFTRIWMEGYTYSHRPGYPRLPVKVELIELPQGAVPRIKLVHAEYTDIDLADEGYPAPLFPAQLPVSKDREGQTPFCYDASVYAMDAFVGGKGLVSGIEEQDLAQVEVLGEMRGTRIGRVTVAPFQYNPATHTLRVYTVLNVEIGFENSDMAATYAKKTRYASPCFSLLASEMLNPIQVPMPKAEAYDCPIPYVIVADPMFRDSLQGFVEWKTRLGFDVRQAYTDNPEVGDTKESIKAYLSGLYNEATAVEPAPVFVLLVGDIEQVPTAVMTAEDASQASDLYLCEYTGDYFPDVQYGRMSASTVEELMPQLRKTMEMESIDPGQAAFMDTTMLIAGVDPNHGESHLNPTVDYLYNEYFHDTLRRHCYLYHYPESGSRAEDIIRQINAGLSFVTYTAHGYASGWADPAIGVEEVREKFRNKGKYPFVVGNCCTSGKFDDAICFGEALLRKEEGGAVAYIGASNSSYFDHDVYWSVGYASLLMAGQELAYANTGFGANDALFHTHGEPFEDWALTAYDFLHAGNMSVQKAAQGFEEYYWQIYHVFGDPSFMPYAHAPQAMEVVYGDTLVAGDPEYAVYAEPHARVVLSQGTRIIAVAAADEYGKAVLGLSDAFASGLAEPGSVSLAVVAQRFVPFLAQVALVESSTKQLALLDPVIRDEEGEAVQEGVYAGAYSVSYALRNIGQEAVSTVRMRLTSLDEYLAVEEGDFVYEGALAPGQETAVEHGFKIAVSPDVPDGHTCRFRMEAEADGNAESAVSKEYVFRVSTSGIRFAGFRICDSASAEPDGLLGLGETVTGLVTLVNEGSAVASEGLLRVSSPDADYLEFPSEAVPFGDIAPGGQIEVPFEYGARNSGLNYAVYTLEMKADTKGREVSVQVQSYTGPIVETFESGDFAFAPWDEASAWVIDQTWAHGGKCSAASAGIGDGESTSLSLTVDVPMDDRISFYYCTSTEAYADVAGDFLHFSIDGEEMGKWGGESEEWRYAEFPLAAGVHSLEWRYQKDASSAMGQDRVWVDDIRLPIGSVAPVAVEDTMASEPAGEDVPALPLMVLDKIGEDEIVLAFHAASASEGRLYLLDATGRRVRLLASSLRIDAGMQARAFRMEGLPAGLYICVYETAGCLHPVKFVLGR